MAQQNPPMYYRPPGPRVWDYVQDALWVILRGVNLTLLVMIAAVVGVAAGSYTGIAKVVPKARDLGNIQPGSGSRIVSADGEVLAVLSTENRQFIPIDRIPKNLQNAAVATEDRDFYRHVGVNPRGILRAAFEDVREGGPRQGGSTITQQTAGSLYHMRQQRTLSRKFAELVLALQLERAYTKPEILELYLNQIYLGEGAYGVQVAAKTYFGKDVQDLDLSECALLVGLAPAPERYSPFENKQLAIDRRDTVLGLMAEQGYITPEQEEEAKAEPLKLAQAHKPTTRATYKAPYFVSYVMKQFADKYGWDALYQGQYTIHTTLNYAMQQAAETAIHRGLARNRWRRINQMALVAVDTHTGAIKAMVGGSNFNKSQYNRTVQGGRPAGSSFKPFVYTAALLQGYGPESRVSGGAVSYPGGNGKRWSPRNYGGEHYGTLTFRQALYKSVNTAAVRVASMVGIHSVMDVAEKMGIPRDQMQPVLPLAIGYCNVTPLQMASAFSIFATRGMRTEPYAIAKVVDARGRTVDEHKPITWRVLDSGIAATMVDMLSDVIKRGTAYGISHLLDFPAAGKTGTSNDFKDAWFVGFTDDLSTAVWAGTDNFTDARSGTAGGTVSAPVWADFMVKAQPIIVAAKAAAPREQVEEITPPKPKRERAKTQNAGPGAGSRPDLGGAVIDEPTNDSGTPATSTAESPNIVTRRICPESGLLAGPNCPDPRDVTYDLSKGDRPPDRVCDIHNNPQPSGQDRSSHVSTSRARQKSGQKPGYVTLSVCAITGKLATPYCPIVVTRTFRADEAPTETCTRHGRR